MVASVGDEKLTCECEEGPRVHDSTLGKHKEQEKTMANSTWQSTAAKIELRWLAVSNGDGGATATWGRPKQSKTEGVKGLCGFENSTRSSGMLLP